MNEELFDIRARVTNKANVLIEKLKEYQDGPVGAEEYGRAIWDREALRSICNIIFNETVREMRKEIKTLQQCKDELARKYGAKDFEHAVGHTNLVNELHDEVAELYASQFKPFEKTTGGTVYQGSAAEMLSASPCLNDLVESVRQDVTPDTKVENPDKAHFDKMLLKELVWKLDREVWAHVQNPSPSEEWSTSKAREESRKLIAEYIGRYDDLHSLLKTQQEEIDKLKKQFTKEGAIDQIKYWEQEARIKELEEALRKSLKYVDEGSCMLQDTECAAIKKEFEDCAREIRKILNP